MVDKSGLHERNPHQAGCVVTEDRVTEMEKPRRKAHGGSDDQSPNDISDVTWSASSFALPEEGVRLVRTFLDIRSPRLRNAVVKFVADLARIDEAEKWN